MVREIGRNELNTKTKRSSERCANKYESGHGVNEGGEKSG